LADRVVVIYRADSRISVQSMMRRMFGVLVIARPGTLARGFGDFRSRAYALIISASAVSEIIPGDTGMEKRGCRGKNLSPAAFRLSLEL